MVAVVEEVCLQPESSELAGLCESIIRVQKARRRLLQLPEEPMHAHYDVFPGGQVIYSHRLGGCQRCR